MDIYLSSISNHMNEIMKVLTIISTIFIPLTFAGIEGMNFKVMPELEWAYGYPVLLLFMGLISVMMLLFFRKSNGCNLLFMKKACRTNCTGMLFV